MIQINQYPARLPCQVSGKHNCEYPAKIRQYTNSSHKTLLGVGPMSQNIVDVTIELAEKHDVPLMLIASRRIDSEYHGGGYVNNWTTEDFS